MNVENLNKLIAHLEAQPPEWINMGWVEVKEHECGTCGCIAGHAAIIEGKSYVRQAITKLAIFLDMKWEDAELLAEPDGWRGEQNGVRRYPAHRVIATLKRLRDTYLTTGQVVVDWGPEPGEEPKTPWVAPQVAEVIAPALPAEITSLLRPAKVEV